MLALGAGGLFVPPLDAAARIDRPRVTLLWFAAKAATAGLICRLIEDLAGCIAFYRCPPLICAANDGNMGCFRRHVVKWM